MRFAIAETDRRRNIQTSYNIENGIVPETIIKDIRPPLKNMEDEEEVLKVFTAKASRSEIEFRIKELEKQMREAAKNYDFENAAEIRDIIFEIKATLNK
ncbi:MAG TPA: UvrB/UvrC motif-containing protein, partial [Bacilli bacterium]|nr:UvrB/UvrC motif-containing protein [Bacilli bacterium]